MHVIIGNVCRVSCVVYCAIEEPLIVRIEAFVQRGVRLGLYLANDSTPTELATDSDDNLFESVLGIAPPCTA